VAQPIPLDLRNAGRDPEKYDEVNRQGVGVGESGDPAHTLTTACVHGVAQPTFALDEYNQSGHKEVCYPLRTAMGDGIPKVNLSSMAVRRLTPTECERLQGFPDGYTNIPWRKKDESPDGPRYKALGNSMAVPVMAWIGSRIQQMEKI
jgi:DNA (cytosine-5)-methyltransferase 1